eukprot:735644-Ditylum_brightwellii.AAC.1
MLLDPFSQDDELFVESYTYPGALGFLRPYECKLIPVPINEHGIQPEQLSTLLQESSSSHSSSYPFREINQQKRKKRRVLHTIPTAQNPSRSTPTNNQRIDIYHLACKYDLVILEDDPYYFLHPNRQCIPSFIYNDHNLGDGRNFIKIEKLYHAAHLGFVPIQGKAIKDKTFNKTKQKFDLDLGYDLGLNKVLHKVWDLYLVRDLVL